MSGTYHHSKKQKLGQVPSDFKKLRSKKRKAQVKKALRNEDYDNIPKFKKSDKYDFF